MTPKIKTKIMHGAPVGVLAFLMSGIAQMASAQTLVSTTTPGTPTTALEGMTGTNIVIAMFAVCLLLIGSIIAFKMDKNI